MTQIPQDAINEDTPPRDGMVTIEQAHGRYRIEVRYSETDADFLWLSPDGWSQLAEAATLHAIAAITAERAEAAAAERQRLLDAITQCKTVFVWPANGYLADAVPYAQIRDLFAGQIPSDPAAAERQRIRQLEAALEIATTTLHRLALIDEIAGMGQRDHDPELKARCRKAQLALDGIADLLDPAEPTDAEPGEHDTTHTDEPTEHEL